MTSAVVPTTPVFQALIVVGVVACLMMIFGLPLAGLAMLVAALVIGVALRISGLR